MKDLKAGDHVLIDLQSWNCERPPVSWQIVKVIFVDKDQVALEFFRAGEGGTKERRIHFWHKDAVVAYGSRALLGRKRAEAIRAIQPFEAALVKARQDEHEAERGRYEALQHMRRVRRLEAAK